MSEFKVGDRVRVLNEDKEHGSALAPLVELRGCVGTVLTGSNFSEALVSIDTPGEAYGDYWLRFAQLEHVETEAPSPEPAPAEEAKTRRIECNVASHEEMAAECTRLRAENAELLRENAALRRRIEKLEKKR